MKIIGLMSGTSADGVDACLARIGEEGGRLSAQILASETFPYPAPLRERILRPTSIEDACRLNVEVGEVFAAAALAVAAGDRADAIGSHGQTICHLDGATLQVGEACIIAERTGLTTVADFRPRDIAAGGTGAPLVPIVDLLLLGDAVSDRVALNIGGIANLSLLPVGASVNDVIAFDSGPGNMVIDALIEIITDGEAACDRNGATAAGGTPCEELLADRLADRYFSAPPPKSTGREAFGRDYAEALLADGRARGLADADIVATATALSARSIVAAFPHGAEVIASGGGVHNPTLMRMLAEAAPSNELLTSDRYGIDPDAKEALAFAILAYLTLNGRPGNCPRATGARRPVVLGKIIPGGAAP